MAILRQRHETPLAMMIRLEPDDFMGVVFGSKGPLRAGGRDSRFAGIVGGGPKRPSWDMRGSDETLRPIGKVCPSCNIEFALRQVECC
jgi:hypothetical protein